MKTLKTLLFFSLLFASTYSISSTLEIWQRLGWGGGSGPYSSVESACGHPQAWGYWIVQGETFQCQGGAIAKITRDCPSGHLPGATTCGCPPPNTTVNGQCVVPAPVGGEVCGTATVGGNQFDKITTSSGGCVVFFEADKPSECSYLSKNTQTGLIRVNFGGDGKAIQPDGVYKRGCFANVLSVEQCKAPAAKSSGGVTLSPAPATCMVALDFTGAVENDDVPYIEPSDSDEGVCYPGQDCKPPESPLVTESTPCKYEWDQSIGMQVCRSTKFTGKPGDYTSCGTGPDGIYKCYGRSPTSNGIDIRTEIKTEEQADGSTKTTKTDTHDKVVCSGVGSCTTTTTKTTQVTIKDGNGNTTGQTTTCTGANCSQTGAGGLGDSDGDGADDCQKSDTCEGGPGGPVEMPELDEQPTVAETTEAYFNRIKNAPIAQALSIVVPSGGSCAAGTAQTFFGSISFDSFCQLAPSVLAGLRYLFLAIWAWAAIRLFFTA